MHTDIKIYTDRETGDSTNLQWSIHNCLGDVENMRSTLKQLAEGRLTDDYIVEYANALIQNQRHENRESKFYGAWRVIPGDDCKIPADARVDMIYTPTYLAISFLSRMALERPAIAQQVLGLDRSLSIGSKFAIGRKLSGAGYDHMEGLIDALGILKQGRVLEYFDLHTYIDSDSRKNIERLASLIKKRTRELHSLWSQGKTKEGWWDYEELLKSHFRWCGIQLHTDCIE